MIGLLQVVTFAEVIIDYKISAEIQKGIIALIGIEASDTEKNAEKLVSKIIQLRIFPDENGKMNESLVTTQYQLMLVPQFTLVAETNKGTRPGFSSGMAPTEAKKLFEYLVEFTKKQYNQIASGKFGVHMRINLCNDGPLTFILKE